MKTPFFSDTLPMMGLRRLFVPAGLLLLVLGMLLVSRNLALASGSLSWLPAAQSASFLEMQLSVSPDAAQPGDELVATLTVVNRHSEMLAPQISLLLPDGVMPDMQALPPGTSFNFRRGFLAWQPLIAGSGGVAELNLTLAVTVAQTGQPEQTIRALLQHDELNLELQQSVWIGLPPRAAVVLEQAQAAIGQPLQLRAGVTGSGPYVQQWQLGDGRVVDAEDPVVVYPVEGTYEITLHLDNPLARSSATSLVEILPQPAAAFDAGDDTVALNTAVQFIDRSGGKPPLAYRWDFGDGNTSDQAAPAHVYTAPGNYDVRLFVENAFGVSQYNASVSVGAPPLAELILPPTIAAGSPLQAEARTDASVSQVRWTMGDGRAFEGSTVRHVFWSAGSYLVTMTSVNQYGETSISQWVEVTPGNLYLFLPLLQRSSSAPVLVPLGDNPAPGDDISQGSPEDGLPDLEPLDLPANTTPAESLFAYINEARRINGLPSLNLVQALNVASQAHTDDMALNGFTSHTGSDGSSPPYRISQAGYPGGYGGETTAWGMQSALDAVRFWLESPPHRAILLNRAVTDLGVGYSVDYQAPNVWYWTAEFASPNLPVVAVTPLPVTVSEPETVLQLLGPPHDSVFALEGDSNLIFTWSWAQPLAEDQRFAVYLRDSLRTYQIGAVRQGRADNQYQYKVVASEVPAAPGDQFWLVRLEDEGTGTTIAESSAWPIRFTVQTSAPPTSSSTESDLGLPVQQETAGPSDASGESGPRATATPLPVATPLTSNDD